MKSLRKILSLILAGVIGVTSLFCGTVAASAVEKLPYYGYYSEDGGKFIVYLTGVSDEEVAFITNELKGGASLWAFLSFSSADGFVAVNDMYLPGSGSTRSLVRDKVTKKGGIGKNEAGNHYFFEIDMGNPDGRNAAAIIKNCDSCRTQLYTFKGVSNYGSKHTTYNDRSDEFEMPFSASSAKPDFDAFYAAHEQSEVPEGKSMYECSFTAIPDQVYTGKEIKPAVTIKDGSKTLTEGTDFTVTYSNNTKVGTADVTVRGIGGYRDVLKRTFNINPPAVTLKVKKSDGKYKLTWKAVKGTTKYEIEYHEDVDGDSKTKTVKVGGSKKSKTIKLDNKNKAYTFRIRSYQTVNGKKYYSEWSKAVKK